MSFETKIKEIDSLKQNIEARGTIDPEILKKINYRFRLDWNFYSNAMEGNTLTREETRSVMINNIDVHGKPIKDIMEMRKHDETIQTILAIGKGELNIAESRIKQIHEGIMYAEASLDKEQIGKWKTKANIITNYRGENYEFTPPLLVAEEIHQLINWLNAESEKISKEKKDAIHPIQLAFDFHLRYVTIHPFFDGNGRTARILMNLILIRNGYPPLYIKDNEKDAYYRYLADVQAYGGDRDLLFETMAGYLLRSMQIVQKAIDGEELMEATDLDKQLDLLEAELAGIDSKAEVQMRYSKEAFVYCYDRWIKQLIANAIPVIRKFDRFFIGPNHYIFMSQAGVSVAFKDQTVAEILASFENSLNLANTGDLPQELRIQASYGTFKKAGLDGFGCNYSIRVRFDLIKYETSIDLFNKETLTSETVIAHERLLHTSLSGTEIDTLLEIFASNIFSHIDVNTKKIGLRK